jgi:hypothetical protein
MDRKDLAVDSVYDDESSSASSDQDSGDEMYEEESDDCEPPPPPPPPPALDVVPTPAASAAAPSQKYAAPFATAPPYVQPVVGGITKRSGGGSKRERPVDHERADLAGGSSSKKASSPPAPAGTAAKPKLNAFQQAVVDDLGKTLKEVSVMSQSLLSDANFMARMTPKIVEVGRSMAARQMLMGDAVTALGVTDKREMAFKMAVHAVETVVARMAVADAPSTDKAMDRCLAEAVIAAGQPQSASKAAKPLTPEEKEAIALKERLTKAATRRVHEHSYKLDATLKLQNKPELVGWLVGLHGLLDARLKQFLEGSGKQGKASMSLEAKKGWTFVCNLLVNTLGLSPEVQTVLAEPSMLSDPGSVQTYLQVPAVASLVTAALERPTEVNRAVIESKGVLTPQPRGTK